MPQQAGLGTKNNEKNLEHGQGRVGGDGERFPIKPAAGCLGQGEKLSGGSFEGKTCFVALGSLKNTVSEFKNELGHPWEH